MQKNDAHETDRKKLDQIISNTTEYDSSKIPSSLIKDINKWKWGSYGWISPVSLIITAAWRKYLYPLIDCCKIWARDSEKKPILGGYSIRTEDEKVTIPLMAKYDLCTEFCSPNSGMQGSRAIEKMRSEKRLNKNFNSTQATVFDLKLFAVILNEINKLKPEQALEVFKMLILKACERKQHRIDLNQKLQNTEATGKNFNLPDFLSKTSDPELTKCVVAACFDVLFENSDLTLTGVEDYKTAADARAKKPGDIALCMDEITIIAVEVKDKTQEIDWNNIDRAKNIMSNCPELVDFIYVLEKRSATVTKTIKEIVESKKFKQAPYNKISFMSVHDLLLLANSVSGPDEVVTRTGKYLSLAPAIKTETKEKWVNLMND